MRKNWSELEFLFHRLDASPVELDSIKNSFISVDLRLPRFDGHELGPKKGLNDDKKEGSRGNAPAA
jgi:hypothetical protein